MTERPVYLLTRLQRFGLAMLVLVALGMVGGSVVIWSGYYNVSANREHWGITTWLLTQVRDQSIRARADDVTVPDLSDPGLIALGAEHYKLGCSSCHGDAGEAQNPVYANMLPRPPDLRKAADDYDAGALYWIVHSGLKYTGMPAWPAVERGDEVWSVVAFLEALNRAEPAAIPALARQDDSGQVAGNCARCHGDAATPPINDRVPSLNGQNAVYLARALEEYRAGRRPSGIMAPIAHALSDADIAGKAEWYANLPPVREGPEQPIPPALMRAGRVLAKTGDAAGDLPACVSCHSGAAQFPRLEGLSRLYIETQLHLWRAGGRDASAHGAIMAVIGQRMTDAEVAAAAAYYASQLVEDTP